jgi:hypothetical protein
LAILTTSSLISQGSIIPTILSVSSFIQALIIFTISIKHGEGGLNKIDITAFVISMLGIIAWQTTQDAVYGLIFSLLADFVGTYPTIRKSFISPFEESYIFYGIDVIASWLNIVALNGIYTIDTIYSWYLLLINLIVTLIIIVRRKMIS